MRASRLLGTTALAGALLIVILAVGVKLRMEEPLSSPALGAEDPYTHVVFAKEALERGWFGDSVYLGTAMYPPGLHALIGVVAPLSGVSLYDMARFVPVVFGALAIAGTFVLVARLAGPGAGLAAALVTAVMPEHVFRTNLLFPTALDLAILPAYLLLFHFAQEPGDHRWGAAAMFLVATVPLAFTHPWAVPLFVAPALGYAMLRAVREEKPRNVARRLVLPAATAALATAFAMASRWDRTDSGFAGFLAQLGPLAALGRFDFPFPILFVVLAGAIGAMAAAGVFAAEGLAYARAASPRVLRLGVGVAAGVALALAAWRIGSGELPAGVNFIHNIGLVAILLALVGVGLALASPSRAGDMGVCLALVLFPLTAFNVFHSPFWPQRTVVYLAVAVALLAGSAVGWTIGRATETFARGRGARIVAPVAILASVLLVGGAVATHPASTYPWYRLYQDDEFAVLDRLAHDLDAHPGSRVVVYSWQPAVVLRALGEPDHPRYAPKFFSDASARGPILAEKGEPKYVLVDAYLKKAEKAGKVDLSFLSSGYRVVDRSASGSLVVYQREGAG